MQNGSVMKLSEVNLLQLSVLNSLSSVIFHDALDSYWESENLRSMYACHQYQKEIVTLQHF